jgi:ribosomal protein L11 methyltransferase
MSWLQVSLDVSESEAPLLEWLFENLGALSVTLGDAADQPLLESPPESQQLWPHTRVTALFEGEQDQQWIEQTLTASLNKQWVAKMSWERIEDRIWERVWLDHFKPMRFGKRLWIYPSNEHIEQADCVVVQLDPGLAFGTGTHPTTALCLEWLECQPLQGKHLVDYGCGSGILAIAALKLGAASAIAIDHDHQALQASRENAEKNGVTHQLMTCLPEKVPTQSAEILVANILAAPLIELAPQLLKMIQPGGRLALSGILEEQYQQVADHYRSSIHLDPIQQREEWVLISGTKVN